MNKITTNFTEKPIAEVVSALARTQADRVATLARLLTRAADDLARYAETTGKGVPQLGEWEQSLAEIVHRHFSM